LYYVAVQKLPQAVLEYVRKHELLRAGNRIGIAVSGGADSVALLRLLLELRKELGIVLSAVHFNHKLRGAESDEDERFVAQLARQHKLELRCESGAVADCAAKKHLSLETAAREMRYRYFRRLLADGTLNRIATGHTLDDQAETVLLKLVRGAGTRGLAGIYPQVPVSSAEGSDSDPSIIRPLLRTRRRELEVYLLALGQGWREDKSNRDVRHLRNRVRHGILPRLERYLNPAVREALSDTAEIARAEEEYWQQEVASVLPQVWNATDASAGILSLSALKDFPLALQRRVVRTASESLGLRLDFHHVKAVLALTSSQAGSSSSTGLPDGGTVSRRRGELHCDRKGGPSSELNYEYRLPVPGSVEVRETRSRFEAVVVPGNTGEGYNPEDLLDRSLLAAGLRVRNWRPGDRFRPAHTKGEKKIKELLQDRQVSGRERKLWPVVVNGTDVVWVRGFPAPAHLQPNSADDSAVLIREVRL
jgi:tRNA(Ile)-lysidine synthase